MNDNPKPTGRFGFLVALTKIYLAGLLLIVLPHKDRREVVDQVRDQLRDKHPSGFERFEGWLRTMTNK